MAMSDQKYIDPSDVLNSIVDEYGYFFKETLNFIKFF